MRLVVLVIILICVMILGYAVMKAEESGAAADIVDAASDVVYDKVFTRKPGTMPVLPSYKISDFKELYQHPAIPGEVPEKYHAYLKDNNLYTNEIHISPNEVYICKALRFGKGEHILYTSVGNDSFNRFAAAMKKAMDGTGKKYEPEEIRDMPANTKMYIYDVTELRDKKSPLVGSESRIKYMSLQDKEGAVIWEYAYEDIYRKQGLNKIYDNKRILDVKKLDAGQYMLLMRYDEFDNVLYVDTNAQPRVVEAYTVNSVVVAINKGVYVYPTKGKILNDNTVWFMYKSGKTKLFRVRLTTAEVIAKLIKNGGDLGF